MKGQKFLKVVVTTQNSGLFFHPLKMSESHLPVKLAKDNKSVEFSICEASKEEYNLMFGV